MSRAPQDAGGSVVHPGLMAVISPLVSSEPTLHVDHFGLSIGAVSVGLPANCTTDTVFRRYWDLVGLLEQSGERAGRREVLDLDVLAAATHLSVDAVAARLDAFAA